MVTTQWNLSAISININGMKTSMRNNLKQLHNSKMDIFIIQETKLHEDEDIRALQYNWKSISNGKTFATPATPNRSGGVAVLLSAHACKTLSNIGWTNETTNTPRYAAISATLADRPVQIHAVYAPVFSQERPTFFNSLPHPTTTVLHIAGGDFNCTLDSQLDSENPNHTSSEGTAELLTWCAALGMEDFWRKQHPTAKEHTSPTNKNRIDMILISPELTQHAKSKITPRLGGSDHRCPTITLASSNTKMGKGHWQMPIWLIPKAAKIVDNLLDQILSLPQTTQATAFPKFLQQITHRCRNLHKIEVQRRTDNIVRTRRVWRQAQATAIQMPTEEHITDALNARQAHIDAQHLAHKKNKEVAFDNHFTKSEKCTAFFLRNTTNSARRPVIASVRRADGTTTNSPKDIADAHRSFWAKLYDYNNTDDNPPPTTTTMSPLLDSIQTTLTPEQRTKLEQPLTAPEIEAAINALPKQKATGPDGIKAELLQANHSKWAKLLTTVFEQVTQVHNQLPPQLRTAVIILLYKKGMADNPANFRPIALLSTVAKVLTSAHNQRIRPILQTLVPHAQTGFIPGRSITENLVLVQDILHWARNHCPQAIILCLDFQKAYDRVDWKYLHAILHRLHFGPRWCNFIRTLYTNRTAHLSINGHLDDAFPIKRGVLQGDPISPSLFILQAIPLCYMINRLRQSHGIPLTRGLTTPVGSFYADDSTLIARSPHHAVDLYNIANSFCAGSGAKLHPQKCVAISATPSSTSLPNGIPILPAHQTTTILGLPIGTSVTREQQIKQITAKMIQRCSTWAHVGRTLQGRAVICQAIILSVTWYILAAIPISIPEAQKMQRVVHSFMHRAESYAWNMTTKRGNFTSRWFYIPKRAGGLGLSPIIATLKARKLSMLRAFLKQHQSSSPKSDWHTVAMHSFKTAMQGWAHNARDIVFWPPPRQNTRYDIGTWSALPPWWRCTWAIWLSQEWNIPPHQFQSAQSLAHWPIWHNRLLTRLNGGRTPLYRTATSASTKQNHHIIRALGFLSFSDFLKNNLSPMNGTELHAAVTQRLTQRPLTTRTIPRGTCTALAKRINTLWKAAKTMWLTTTAHPHTLTDPQAKLQWATVPWTLNSATSFTACTNRMLTKSVLTNMQQGTPPPWLKYNGIHLPISWPTESHTLKLLAPSRRDLIFRLQRDALPLGVKRATWGQPDQILCPLCKQATETAAHLFWHCTYAKRIWKMFTTHWKISPTLTLTWPNIPMGTGWHLPSGKDKHTEALAGIIRACTCRVIWLERNFRVFNPNTVGKPWLARANQAALDIAAHVSSATRRLPTATAQKITVNTNWLKANDRSYCRLLTGQPLTSPNNNDNS